MSETHKPAGNGFVHPKPGQHPSRKNCRICDAPLDVHQAARGLLCDRIECRTQWAARFATQRDRRHQRNDHLARRLAFQAIENLVQENKIQRRADFQVATVPASQSVIRPANWQRQQSYREHFEQLLAAWQEQHPETDPNDQRVDQPVEDPVNETDMEPADDPIDEPSEIVAQETDTDTLAGLFGQSCATCRGKCCLRGGTHAFQTVETLDRWFALHPDASVEDCREAYFSHLKSNSVEGSCVFHGSRGCELPRAWRGDMCNTWICHSLQRIRKNHDLHGKTITIIVATEPGLARRVNVVRSATGERLEPEMEIPS